MKTRTVDNSQDILDSRDIDKRIEELEEEKEEFVLNESVIPEEESPSWGEVADTSHDAESKWDETDEGQELEALIAFRDELQGYASDWRYGATLIRDSYFTEYCQELVKDVGDMPNGIPAYIENNINWDGVASDLQVGYTSAEFDGVTYWVRS